MKNLVWILCALFATATQAAPAVAVKKPLIGELLKNSQPSDWREVDPENTMLIDLPTGRVVIELAPEFAPQHVANVKALAREKYWDGLAVVRVQDNYVVQWADPNAEKPEHKRKVKNAKEKLAAEFDREFSKELPFAPLPDKDVYASQVGYSRGFPVARDAKAKRMWLLHCYGMVGAGRDNDIGSGGGTELYAVIGQAPRQLDRNVTLLGRVISGMEFFSSLPRGHGDLGFYKENEKQVPITSVRMQADIPERERVHYEVLRTDTPLFTKLLEARKSRHEEWFHLAADHLEVCTGMLPTREKPQK